MKNRLFEAESSYFSFIPEFVITSQQSFIQPSSPPYICLTLILFSCVHYSAGGLVTAVAPVVIECKGLWIGWSGLHDLIPGETIPEADQLDQAPTAGLTSKQVGFS